MFILVMAIKSCLQTKVQVQVLDFVSFCNSLLRKIQLYITFPHEGQTHMNAHRWNPSMSARVLFADQL